MDSIALISLEEPDTACCLFNAWELTIHTFFLYQIAPCSFPSSRGKNKRHFEFSLLDQAVV
jgi:hypothetical protein